MPPSDTDPEHHAAGASGRPRSPTRAFARSIASRRLRGTSLLLAPTRSLGQRIGRFVESFGGRTLIASLAVAGAILVTAVPAFALIATSDDSSSRLQEAVPGAPASAVVSDLGVTTFIGDIPFLAQQRYLTAAAGGEAEGKRFVDGARQAAVASYVYDVGLQMTLPYLSGATEEKREIEAWTDAVEQHQEASVSYGFQPAWPAGGTSLGSTVTFYTCAGGGFCGAMAAGPVVHNGAAACSYDLPFGTRFYLANDPAQRVFTCLDRGLLTPTWVDIWFHSPDEGWAFQALVGTFSTIVIVG